jgi:hypothetical protein
VYAEVWEAVEAALRGEWRDPDEGRCSYPRCRGRVTGTARRGGRIEDVCSVGGHAPVAMTVEERWWWQQAGILEEEHAC